MSKSILFFADGTWNGPGQDQDEDGVADPTNVYKLFCNLDGADTPETTRLANEQEKVLADWNGAPVQVSKYIHGVGDSRNVLVRALGGGVGAGLVARIVRGYTFVSRNYRPDDRLFLIGFSRGAYTARALAGLISARGLLDATKLPLHDKEETYRLGSDVWFDYRRQALAGKTSRLDRIHELASGLKGFLSSRPPSALVSGISIDVVAVWDTVGSLGIPQYTVDAERVDAFEFADRKLSGQVRRGLHAVAIDEQRADFTPTLWDDDSRVTQVLFPGAHSDVGGGYPAKEGHSGLSDGALRWMMLELGAHAVRFSTNPAYFPAPDVRGVGHRPWMKSPWDKLPRALRQFGRHLRPDACVTERMGCGAVPCELEASHIAYAPTNLPV